MHDSTSGPPRPVIRPKTCGEVALIYFDFLGWTVIPARGKIPLIHWNPTELPCQPTREWLERQWRAYVNANLALVTGKRSRIIVADADPRHGGSLEAFFSRGWPRQTPTARSGGCEPGDGGGHAFYSYPDDGQPVPSAPVYGEGLEVKSEGAIVILAPSTHPKTRRRYEWLAGFEPWNLELAPLPDALLADLRARRPNYQRLAPERDYTTAETRDLVYDEARTLTLATRLINAAIRRVDPDKSGRDHRNNTAFWLGFQLGTLGFSDADIAALVALYSEKVRHDDDK